NRGSASYMAGLLLVFPLWLAKPTVGAGQQVVDTDICTLVARPKDFNKKTVRVRAQVESGVEAIALVADSCTKGIALRVAKGARDSPDQKALDDAIFRQGYVGTVGKKITAVFTGQFLWQRRGHPKRVLVAQKVEDLKVELTKPAGNH